MHPVHAYAAAIVSGEIVAGPHIRWAAERHQRDIEQTAAGNSPWHFDATAADRVLEFFPEVLLLIDPVSGDAVPFNLLPWQQFVVGSWAGWLDRAGLRRFTTAYVETGKGSGKSPLAAGIGLYMQTADREPQAEIYAAATSKDQARILFKDAVRMVEASGVLADRLVVYGGDEKWHMITHPRSGSVFKLMASDTKAKSGYRPHGALIDEFHEHPNGDVINMARSGFKGRRQPLLFIITNSGNNRASVCYEYHQAAELVVKGARQDDRMFVFICSLDEGDDPFEDEACWAKANPSLGVTIQPSYLRQQIAEARNLPSRRNVVLRLNFCVWTDAADPWIEWDLWKRCVDRFHSSDLTGLPCYAGLDLAAVRDLLALTVVWVDEAGERLRKVPGARYAITWFWRPGQTLDDAEARDGVPYRQWMDEGYLLAPDVVAVRKRSPAWELKVLAASHDLRAIAYDQAQSAEFIEACDEIGFDVWIYEGEKKPMQQGIPLWRHGQGFGGFANDAVLWMPNSINQLEARVVDGSIIVADNPVMTYCSASGVLMSDETGNRKWDKKRANGRIDGMLSLTMANAASEAMAIKPKKKGSIYDREDLNW